MAHEKDHAYGSYLHGICRKILQAQTVPGLINYQGRLMDGTGAPITDASVPMTFMLWDDPLAGSSLWSESQAVAVSGGLYSVLRGDSVPIPASILSGQTVYLEVSVFGETLSPRQRLTSVPYALRAQSTGSAADSDLLDGYDAIDFASAFHSHSGADITSGSIGDAFYSCYSDLTTEGYLDNNAASDLLTQSQSDGRYTPLTHSHSGADISAGTVGTDYYSAYDDLSAEGRLDDNDGADLETRAQADARFVNATTDSMTGSLTIGQFLTVSGGNIGIGTIPTPTYGIVNSSASAPPFGATLFGSSSQIMGIWSTDQSNSGSLGKAHEGVTGSAGHSLVTDERTGGKFSGQTRGTATGVSAEGQGYGAGPAYGVYGTAAGNSNGDAYGA